MPRSPDDCERRQPARKSKRARRTSTPRHTIATSARLGGIDAASFSPETWLAVEMLLRLPPLRMLAAVIKMVLRDRVTDEELRLICKLYHTALTLRPVEGSGGE
jgi:hypothetical protein